MNTVHSHKVGLAVGGMFALIHAVWACVVALGAAQTYIDWIFGLHFITAQFTVTPFNLGTAVTLVIVAAFAGYIIGYVFAKLLNLAHKKAHKK